MEGPDRMPEEKTTQGGQASAEVRRGSSVPPHCGSLGPASSPFPSVFPILRNPVLLICHIPNLLNFFAA